MKKHAKERFGKLCCVTWGSVEAAKDKLSEHDRKTLLDKSNEVIHWLYKNKYAEKRKELEKVVTPINSKCGSIPIVPFSILAVHLHVIYRLYNRKYYNACCRVHVTITFVSIINKTTSLISVK